MALRDPTGTLPGALLRDRLALGAAVACLKLEGRNESAPDIRDAVCLTRAGDALGPAGEMFVRWRRLARVSLAAGGWKDRVRKMLPAAVAETMPDFGAPAGMPGAQASQILADMLRHFPREEAAALMLADLPLARAVGWNRPVPMLATHIGGRDIRAIADGEDDVLPHVHRAILTACDGVIGTVALICLARFGSGKGSLSRDRKKLADELDLASDPCLFVMDVAAFYGPDRLDPLRVALADRKDRKL